jgi:VCBS repeat-containing protein
MSATKTAVGMAAAALLALAACGTGGAEAGGSGAEAGGPSISITEPADTSTVTQPFTLRVESSEEIGETDTGKDHFHLTFDGNEGDYTVEPDGEVRVDSLSPGEHTIKVTLQHADHSPVGAEDEITVTVQGEGQGSTGDSGGGLGY